MKFTILKSFYFLLIVVLILLSSYHSRKLKTSQPLKHFDLDTTFHLFKEVGHVSLKVINQKSINVFDGCLQYFKEKLDKHFNIFRTFWENMKDFRKGNIELTVNLLEKVMLNLEGMSVKFNGKEKFCTNAKFIANPQDVLNILNQDKYFGKRYDRTKIYHESAMRNRKNLPAQAYNNVVKSNQWENPTLKVAAQNYGSPISKVQ
jgi:hypothetical protein